MNAQQPSPAGETSMLRIVATSSIGTMLEYFDFFVYVALTGTLTHLFLPSSANGLGALVGVATFGVAYLARPLGTLVFSPMADRLGRKRSFVITLAIMGIATMAIGCLPTYSQIGIAAPLALLSLRIVQGFALGGEYGSAVVYVMEHAPADSRGRFTSVLQATASVGLLLALLIVSLLKAELDPAQFEAWGWRVPFLLSAPIVGVATWIRLGMRESPVFDELEREGALSESPLADTVRSATSWRAILLAVFSAQGATSVSLYTSIVYMLYFMQNVLMVDAMHTNLCLAAAILVAIPFYPLFGALSDRVGRARVMLAGTVAWLVVAYPAFSGIQGAARASEWDEVAAIIGVMAILTAMIMAPLPAYISECFPARTRTTGFGLAQQIGNILFGGFLPLISLSLVRWSGNPLAGIAYSIASLLPCVIAMYCWGLKQDASYRRSCKVEQDAALRARQACNAVDRFGQAQ